MRVAGSRLWFSAGMVLAMVVSACSSVFAADSPDIDAKVSLESRMEERVEAVLREVIGKDRFVVIVTANIDTKKEQVPIATSRSKKRKKSKERDELALPGVPVKKKFGMHRDLEEGTQLMMDRTRTFVKSLYVSLILEESLSDRAVEIATDVVGSILALDEDRGDRLDVKRVKFDQGAFRWSSLGHPPHLYWVILVTLGAFFLLVASRFLMNPFRTLGENLGAAFASLNPSGGGGGGGAGGGGQTIETHAVFSNAPGAGSDETATGSDEPLPFAYVREDHVPRLRVLLESDTDENIAIAANYLAPEHASRLLELFPEERRSRVAAEWAKIQQLDPEKVRALDERVKGTLDYLMGGEDKLLSVLDGASDELRASIFTAVDAADAPLGRRLRTKVMSFESIIQKFDKTAIQVLFRRSDVTAFARILKSAPEEIRNKVTSSLTEGAVDRLHQEMDLSRELSPKRLEEEKRKIVSAVRRMVRDGVIETEES